jgi:hypothetical protein
VNGIAFLNVPGDGAAAAEDLVIGMGGQYQHRARADPFNGLNWHQ